MVGRLPLRRFWLTVAVPEPDRGTREGLGGVGPGVSGKCRVGRSLGESASIRIGNQGDSRAGTVTLFWFLFFIHIVVHLLDLPWQL